MFGSRLRPDHIDMAFYFFKLALSKHLTRLVVHLNFVYDKFALKKDSIEYVRIGREKTETFFKLWHFERCGYSMLGVNEIQKKSLC